MSDDQLIIEEVRSILKSRKDFSVWPVWEEDGESWSFLTGLLIADVSIVGLRVRGTASAFMDREIVIQLEVLRDQRWLHICRCEFAPVRDHRNPLSAVGVPRRIPQGESHVHSFDDNIQFRGLDACSPALNLPVARSLEPQPKSVREFFRAVAMIVGVSGFADFTPPPWQGRLSL